MNAWSTIATCETRRRYQKPAEGCSRYHAYPPQRPAAEAGHKDGDTDPYVDGYQTLSRRSDFGFRMRNITMWQLAHKLGISCLAKCSKATCQSSCSPASGFWSAGYW